MQTQLKSRAYYQYMIDLIDHKPSYYSADEIGQIAFDLLDEGNPAEALNACKLGLLQHPDDEYVELIEAKIFLHMHRFEEAENILKSQKGDEDDPFRISIRFGLDALQNDQDEAFGYLLRKYKEGKLMLQEYTDIIDELFETLPHLLTAKYLKEAYAWYQKHPSKEEKLAECISRIGALLMDSGCADDAIKVFEKALDLDAYDIYSWQDLARCQFDLKYYDDCANSCEMGLAIDPKNPIFNFALGYIRYMEEDYEESAEHLDLARQFVEGKLDHEEINLERQEVESQAAITYDLLGSSYISLNRLDEAIECYQQLVNRVPTCDEGYFHLSTLALDRGDIRGALEYIEKAIEIKPQQTTYLSLRVTLLTDLRRFEEALKGLDDLVKLEPKSKAFLLAQAELSLNLHNYEKADKAYRKLLKMKPSDFASKELMRAYFESIGDNDALNQIV